MYLRDNIERNKRHYHSSPYTVNENGNPLIKNARRFHNNFGYLNHEIAR